MNEKPRYTASACKALEVILWLAERSENTADIYHVVKAVFFADKYHVARHGRPLVGDDYRAAMWGPLPQVVYNLLQKKPFEILALGSNGYVPFQVSGETFIVTGERAPNLDWLSESDVEALEFGWLYVRSMTFDQLVVETHADPAWARSVGGLMDYRDFIGDDDENAEIKRRDLEETAAYMYF